VAPFDVAAARARFTSLREDFVFPDAPGGAQTPDEAGAAVASVYRDASGNTGAPNATSRRIEAVLAEARAASARFLHCDPDEVMFGASMTSLDFMLSRTVGRELRRGDEILVTRLDHDANVAPWLELARDAGLVVRPVDINADTTLDMADLESQPMCCCARPTSSAGRTSASLTGGARRGAADRRGPLQHPR